MPQSVLGLATVWNESLSSHSVSLWVSLTPAAAHALKLAGVNHKPAGEIYDEEEMRGDERAYLLAQIEWAKRLDEWLQSEVPRLEETGVRPAYHHFSKLKYAVDSLMVPALKLQALLKKEKPASVLLVVRQRPVPAFDFDNFEESSEYWLPQLVKDVCAANGVGLKIEQINEPDKVSPASGSKRVPERFQEIAQADLRFLPI